MSYALASNRTFVRFDTTTKSWDTRDLPSNVYLGVVCRDTEVLLDTQILETYKDFEVKPVDLPVFFWLDGVAGCGKTQIICRTYVHGRDMVLAASTATVEEIRNRLIRDVQLTGEKLKNFVDDVQFTVRTDASATLMKRISLSFTKGKRFVPERLFIDEATMEHGGQLVLAAVQCKPKTVILLGDRRQIPFHDRTFCIYCMRRLIYFQLRYQL